MKRQLITEEQYRQMVSKVKGGASRGTVTTTSSRGRKGGVDSIVARASEKSTECIGMPPSPAGSNPVPSPYKSKMEARWAKYLQNLLQVQAIRGWWYETVRFKLPGKRNTYKPDFPVQSLDGLMSFYEVKGWSPSYERSLVKIKTAAGLNPWARFFLVTEEDGQWKERLIE